jgi:beta-lactamase regulating signal transducer with metallopeptidase domain
MLELALRASVIFAAAWALTRAMPRAAAATRHLVWHGALLASLVVALASFAHVPRLPLVPAGADALLPTITFGPTSQATVPAAVAPAAFAPAVAADGANRMPSIARAFGTLNSVVTLGLLLWFGIGWTAAARLSRRARPAPLAWQLEVNALCERLRIARPVALGVIDAPSSPLATGLIRSSVLLPQTAAAWSPDRRRAVLLHELAHVRRHDCRVQLIAQVACAVYWFNPLVWLATAQLHRERERACDDEVLRLGAQASSYAAHLLDIARELRPTTRPSAALAMARPSELEGRLLSVLAVGRARIPARGTRWVVSAVLVLSTLAALSAMPQAPVDAATTSETPPRYVVTGDMARPAAQAPSPRSAAEITLETSADAQERELATLALAFTSGRDVIPALLKALADPDAQVREKAAIGLALRRDDRVLEPLLAAMNDRDAQVREKVAIALGTSGDRRAHEALRRALEDPDGQVREKAAAALVLLGLTGGR